MGMTEAVRPAAQKAGKGNQLMNGRRRAGKILFAMSAPFLIATLLFCYVPMFGWLYSFVNYKAGFSLFSSRWVGLKYFAMPFSNFVLRDEFLRVMRNTLITSGYHLLGSPLPLFFAIFLSEIKFVRYRKSVQILTTVPNFVSWVIVYSVVHSLLSLDGFVNHFLQMLGLTADPINFMATSKGVWITRNADQRGTAGTGELHGLHGVVRIAGEGDAHQHVLLADAGDLLENVAYAAGDDGHVGKAAPCLRPRLRPSAGAGSHGYTRRRPGSSPRCSSPSRLWEPSAWRDQPRNRNSESPRSASDS